MGGICLTVYKEVKSHVFVSHGQEGVKPGLSRANSDTGNPCVGGVGGWGWGWGGVLTHLHAKADQFQRMRVACVRGVR